VKILLDEMWSPEIAHQLRLRGFAVVAVVERADLRSTPDHVIFALARREQRAFMTDNARDLRLIAAAYDDDNPHAGLILTDRRRFNRHDPRVIGQVVTALSALLDQDPDLTNVEHWL
jgi:predicted nuclease of predicted toxin-antitoxin system